MQLVATHPYNGRIRLYKLRREIQLEGMPNYCTVLHTDNQNRLIFPNPQATGIEMLVTSQSRTECQIKALQKPSNLNLLPNNIQIFIAADNTRISEIEGRIDGSKEVSLDTYLQRAKLYFEGEMRKSEFIAPIWSKYVAQAEIAAKKMKGEELAFYCMKLGEKRTKEVLAAITDKFPKPENYFWKK